MSTLPKPPAVGELFPELATQSAILYLDFQQIPADLPDYQNIQKYFADCEAQGINPRSPENRQRFNNNFLQHSGKRYLIGRYGEDRIEMLRGSKIAAEGRSIHLGLDIFTKDCDPILAPCAGEVVATGQQAGKNTFGYYLIFQPDPEVMTEFIFLGHLSKELPQLGQVEAGQQLATLGDYVDDENGGWSRHVHVQLMTKLPPAGTQPRGYSTKQDMQHYLTEYPDPSLFVFHENFTLQ